MAPSKFCALSSKTAVLAFCNAFDSMAFCEGGFELRLDDAVSLLPFAECELCREWPFWVDFSSSFVCRRVEPTFRPAP